MSLQRWISSRGWQACNSYSRIGSLATLHQSYGNVQIKVDSSSCQAQIKSVIQQPLQGRNPSPHPQLHDSLSMSSLLAALPYSTDTDQMLNLTSSDSAHKEYLCPSRILKQFTDLAILDRAVPSHTFYDLPVAHTIILPISTPTPIWKEIAEPDTNNSSGKYAKEIMRIRHKKMKKHKLRKLRKRMYFVWRKRRLAKQNKRNTLFKKELDDIRCTGENFDPKEFVQDQLQKAKRGGYYINIFQSKM